MSVLEKKNGVQNITVYDSVATALQFLRQALEVLFGFEVSFCEDLQIQWAKTHKHISRSHGGESCYIEIRGQIRNRLTNNESTPFNFSIKLNRNGEKCLWEPRANFNLSLYDSHTGHNQSPHTTCQIWWTVDSMTADNVSVYKHKTVLHLTVHKGGNTTRYYGHGAHDRSVGQTTPENPTK